MAPNKRKTTRNLKLSDIGEFSLISMLRDKSRNSRKDIARGIGDDTAVIKSGKDNILITSDMMIEGVHFDLSLSTFYQLGYKFMAVNISDIFAMGGRPDYFNICLGIPSTFKSGWIDELYSGILDLAGLHNVAITGGDTCSSSTDFILSGTLIGRAEKAITRSGARVGDAVYVTDTLGDSAMGLELLRKGGRKLHNLSSANKRTKLIKAHLMPDISVFKNTRNVSSMIDISDGLLIDLCHICDESRVGVEICTEDIPLSAELLGYSDRAREAPLSYALKGGEDYCLLFTAPPDSRLNAFKIGRVIRRGRYLIDKKRHKTPFTAEGYEHFL